MLLGANVFPKTEDPEELAFILKSKGYRAGYFPEGKYRFHQTQEINAVKKAFEKQNLVIAEVGAWHVNPLHPNPEEAKRATEYVIDQLMIAEHIHARCCVNIIGSFSATSCIAPENYSDEFYYRVVDTTRYILDQVKPKYTKMTYEILPFNFLDGADSYVKLVKDVDRPGFAIHLDPINCIISSRQYHNSAQEFKDCVKKLAPYGVASMHIKDLILRPECNIHLEEVLLGTGGLDIKALLATIDHYLPKDTPVMLEHLSSDAEYDSAAVTLRKIAKDIGVAL